jgi:hypothetical protein
MSRLGARRELLEEALAHHAVADDDDLSSYASSNKKGVGQYFSAERLCR